MLFEGVQIVFKECSNSLYIFCYFYIIFIICSIINYEYLRIYINLYYK